MIFLMEKEKENLMGRLWFFELKKLKVLENVLIWKYLNVVFGSMIKTSKKLFKLL